MTTIEDKLKILREMITLLPIDFDYHLVDEDIYDQEHLLEVLDTDIADHVDHKTLLSADLEFWNAVYRVVKKELIIQQTSSSKMRTEEYATLIKKMVNILMEDE